MVFVSSIIVPVQGSVAVSVIVKVIVSASVVHKQQYLSVLLKQEVENQLMEAPFTPERRHRTCHDVAVVMEMLRSIPQRLSAVLLAFM